MKKENRNEKRKNKKVSITESPKRVLLTGASSGIGKELSRLFLQDGYEVIGVSRSAERLARAKEELGAGFTPIPSDVSTREGWAAITDFLRKEGITTLSLLVSAAGILPPFLGVKTSGEEGVIHTEAALQTNYLGAVYGTAALTPYLTEGAVYISSSASLCTLPGVSGYAASKAALSAYASTLSAEKAFPYVGLMLPGFTKTDVFRAQEKADARMDRICMPAPKMAKKIYRAIQKRRRRKILGWDAKCMALLSRYFPRSAPRIVGWVLKKAKSPLFERVFPGDEGTTAKEQPKE